ncbi:hypothetical protein JX265_014115, partial [Neoarthrinium moseri]
MFYITDVYEQLCNQIVESTGGHMSKVLIVSSGSEAMEAAMKLARQYFLEKPDSEPKRVNFIARNQSYHGTTLGSLSMGGHISRRAKGQGQDENDEAYVARLAEELDKEFQRLGPETVCAFVAEPVVGA